MLKIWRTPAGIEALCYLPILTQPLVPSCLLPPSLSQVSLVNRWLLRVVTQKVQQRYLLNSALFDPAVVSNQAYW